MHPRRQVGPALPDRLRTDQPETSEREQAIAETQRFPGISLGWYGIGYGWEQFALELILEAPKTYGQSQVTPATPIPSQVATQRLQEAVSALRLFKSGMIGYSVLRQTVLGWNPFGGTMLSGRLTPYLGAPYTLTPDEVNQFRVFWPQYCRARERNKPRIDLALRRLNSAYERLRPEDRLIDYTIGLEALMTKREETGDLAYRLALRGSRLLGTDATFRAEVHMWLRRAYRLRSDIVHGSEVPSVVAVKSHSIPLAEFVEGVARYLREAIKELMRRTESASEAQAIESLDANIVAGP